MKKPSVITVRVREHAAEVQSAFNSKRWPQLATDISPAIIRVIQSDSASAEYLPAVDGPAHIINQITKTWTGDYYVQSDIGWQIAQCARTVIEEQDGDDDEL